MVRLKMLQIVSCAMFFSIILLSHVQGQESTITLSGEKVSSLQKVNAPSVYKMKVRREVFKSSSDTKTMHKMINLNLNMGDYHWQLDLFEEDLLSPTLINEMIAKGNVPAIAYEGYTSEGGSVRITINDGFVYGYINDNGETYYIEPAKTLSKSSKNDEFIVYTAKEAQLAQDQEEYTCASVLLQQSKSIKNKIRPQQFASSSMACRGLKIGIASDHTMFAKYTDSTGVDNHNVGVMNSVQGDYDGQGSGGFNIEFQIIARHYSTAVANNPYTTTGNDAGVLLSEFRSWVISGGFGSTATPSFLGGGSSKGLALLWTNKNVTYQGDARTVGLANTPGNHCVLEDFDGNKPMGSGYNLRVLTSHEMGHNLSYGHDDVNTCGNGSCIMWPSVQSTFTWSAASITAINNNLDGRGLGGCLANCNNGMQDQGESGVDCGGVCGPCPCSANDTYSSPLNLSITFDNYATESSWDIRSSDNQILQSGSGYSSSNNNQTISIPNLVIPNGNGITINFYDSFGDGICCLYGNGSFSLTDANNAAIFTGSSFTSSISSTFCIGLDACSNGVQDNGEQGVDCGGSCAACTTGCTDPDAHNYDPNVVISNNLLCLTCSDSKQNGDETGVDCGGEKCLPCDCTTSDFASNSLVSADASVAVINSITSSDTILNGTSLEYQAGNSIELNAGFQVDLGGLFEANIESCN